MTIGEALKLIKAAAKAGNVVFHPGLSHVATRMQQRVIPRAAILNALANASGIRHGEGPSKYVVSGPALHGPSLSVVTIVDGVIVIAGSAWRNVR